METRPIKLQNDRWCSNGPLETFIRPEFEVPRWLHRGIMTTQISSKVHTDPIKWSKIPYLVWLPHSLRLAAKPGRVCIPRLGLVGQATWMNFTFPLISPWRKCLKHNTFIGLHGPIWLRPAPFKGVNLEGYISAAWGANFMFLSSCITELWPFNNIQVKNQNKTKKNHPKSNIKLVLMTYAL